MTEKELRIVADQVGSPTLTDDLARAIFNLLALDTPHASRLTPHGLYGLYHFADEGECSWHEFGEAIVAHLRKTGTALKTERILPIATHEYPLPATRPGYSVFSKDKYRKVTGAKIPDWKTSLVTYLTTR